ncbi:MAG: hypothetical protein Solumvirus5_30 [Solumvirus sp.]|uniref:Uncharacterized protein n=1 Tax=Solumvirus sp. TaxID=2487773 RepID=A0A3G5AJV4_9VIRU|nr:MAG: hypothetical protein Solumvirus5_30 [Solumvirus sp.]
MSTDFNGLVKWANEVKNNPKKTESNTGSYAIIAVLLFGLGLGAYFYYNKPTDPSITTDSKDQGPKIQLVPAIPRF